MRRHWSVISHATLTTLSPHSPHHTGPRPHPKYSLHNQTTRITQTRPPPPHLLHYITTKFFAVNPYHYMLTTATLPSPHKCTSHPSSPPIHLSHTTHSNAPCWAPSASPLTLRSHHTPFHLPSRIYTLFSQLDSLHLFYVFKPTLICATYISVTSIYVCMYL